LTRGEIMERKAIMILGLALLFSACTSNSTFLAYKNGQGYYLGNSSNAAHDRFCQSGDLKKILADTALTQQTRDELYESNCGPDHTSAKVKKIYASLTADQRKDLRRAFVRNGYEINYIHC